MYTICKLQAWSERDVVIERVSVPAYETGSHTERCRQPAQATWVALRHAPEQGAGGHSHSKHVHLLSV
jgi:hypothetical protein